MSTAAVMERPLSPPHSIDGGEIGISDHNQVIVPREPYTPHTTPKSTRPAPGAEAGFVSAPLAAGPSPKQEEDLPYQDQYGDPSMYQTAQPMTYYPVQPSFVRRMPYHTPPAAIPDAGIQTRSGRALGSPLEPESTESSRRLRSPKSKKSKLAKGGKQRALELNGPLSDLTKDYKLPIKDMHAWVHRPVEARIVEVDKKKGYISRPMNSFMLYRSAYADRVKQFCKENNHQVVSQVTGASWPMEPPEIRQMYEKYASIERENHAAAHPNYKFAPNKNGSRKRPQPDDDSDEDGEWDGSSRSKKRNRGSRRGDSRSASSTPYDTPRQHFTQYRPPPTLHPSSYQAANPHGPVPLMIGPDGMVGQYFQTTVTPYGHLVDDVKFGRMENPFPQYDMGGALVGLPSANHYDLLAVQQQVGDLQVQGQVLDPQLQHFDPGMQYAQYEGGETGYAAPQHYEYQSYGGQPEYGYAQDVSYYPGLATLTDGRSIWTEPEQIGSLFDEELQKFG